MKISKSKIRKLIKESYQKMQRQQAKLSREPGPGPYIFSTNSKKYLDDVRSYLHYDHGISSDGPSLGTFLLSTGHVLGTPIRSGSQRSGVSFPYGFYLYVKGSKGNSTLIKFTVSGIPEIDAQFISKLCNLQGDYLNYIAALSRDGDKASNIKSWASKIMPGYPHKFVGL